MKRALTATLCLVLGCGIVHRPTLSFALANDQRHAGVLELADRFTEIIQRAMRQEAVVGAQLVIGTKSAHVVSRQFGVLAPGSTKGVDRETLFCIGSCSKPVAAACVMTMVDDGTLPLDEPIDKWLDGFSNPRDKRGRSLERAPTMRELLAHRGGIYSQKSELTPSQVSAIRDFRRTLADSVSIISRQPLSTAPGTSFSYSGAGYCVLGRVCERVAGVDFEDLINARLCRPLGLSRTTYFPSSVDQNIAVGGLS